MNSHTKSTVEQHPTLKLQVNVGERHRIIRSSARRGSLWITPRVDYYCVCPTGEVETLLYLFLCGHFGAETGVDQGRQYWNIEDYGDVAKVIQRFAEA